MSDQERPPNWVSRWIAKNLLPFVARNLDADTVKDIAPPAWLQWRQTNQYYWGIGYRSGKLPPKSGDLLVQSPYADWYYLTWGLAPNADQPKWRWMYRARPEVRHGTDLKAILAVGRGFTIVCEEDEEVESFANQLITRLGLRDVLQSAATDMLVYGTAFFEKVRASNGKTQELDRLGTTTSAGAKEVTRVWTDNEMDDLNEKRYGEWLKDQKRVDDWIAQQRVDRPPSDLRPFATMGQTVQRRPVPTTDYLQGLRDTQFGDEYTGDLVELKAIDPLWMRINRDAFGNVIGWVQWGLTPIPQSIQNEKLVVLKWLPKSWATENAYGTSILMPVARHVSFLVQAEEDMKVFWHQYAKPTLWAALGSQEKPYPLPAISAFQSKLGGRGPNTDIVTPGDVKVEMIKAGTGETSSTFKEWANYLREKIYETLGIPSILMNLPESTTRATSDVSLQAFIAEEQMIQEIVGEQIMKQVIEPEVLTKFSKAPQMRVVWPPILEEDRNKKADRVMKAVGMTPIMSVNEARQEVNLPPKEGEEFDKIPDKPIAGLGNALSPSRSPETNESERTGAREEESQKLDRTDAVALKIPSVSEVESLKSTKKVAWQ